MTSKTILSIQGLLLSLSAGLLFGCLPRANNPAPSPTVAAESPAATTSPGAAPVTPAPATPDPNAPAAPPPPQVTPAPTGAPTQTTQLQPIDPSSLAGQNVACTTPQYFGEITWQGQQPLMNFGRKPNEASLRGATPVAIVGNPDGSRTYGVRSEGIFYLRAFTDGSCMLQTLDNRGAVVVEEYGRLT
jgi:type IV secretory pathway VirB10-like protein